MAGGAKVPDPSGACCWTFLVFPAAGGILFGLSILVERIHHGAGKSDAESAALLAVTSLTALWICWHVSSANAWLGLPVLFTGWLLAFVLGGDLKPFLGYALLFVYYAVASLVRGQQSFGIPFLLPLLVVGPMVVFSSWFWWDVFGIAGWGAVIAAVPLGILMLFLGAAARDIEEEQ